MRLLRYLLGFYAGFLLTMVPIALTIGGWFLLDIWLPFGWALGIVLFLFVTYIGVDQYRLDRRKQTKRPTCPHGFSDPEGNDLNLATGPCHECGPKIAELREAADRASETYTFRRLDEP